MLLGMIMRADPLLVLSDYASFEDERTVGGEDCLLRLERHPGLTSAALPPPTGASQADGECGEQRHVPAAHHLQGLQSCAVRNRTPLVSSGDITQIYPRPRGRL